MCVGALRSYPASLPCGSKSWTTSQEICLWNLAGGRNLRDARHNTDMHFSRVFGHRNEVHTPNKKAINFVERPLLWLRTALCKIALSVMSLIDGSGLRAGGLVEAHDSS